jgi:hypothetical protein
MCQRLDGPLRTFPPFLWIVALLSDAALHEVHAAYAAYQKSLPEPDEAIAPYVLALEEEMQRRGDG